jgi:ribosomal protein S1
MSLKCRNCDAPTESQFEDWWAVCPHCGKLLWLREGDVVSGPVVKIGEFGVFIEFGSGVVGLIHNSELSDEYIKHPSEIVSRGNWLKAVVLRIEMALRRIHLSVKRLGSQQNQSAT